MCLQKLFSILKERNKQKLTKKITFLQKNKTWKLFNITPPTSWLSQFI